MQSKEPLPTGFGAALSLPVTHLLELLTLPCSGHKAGPRCWCPKRWRERKRQKMTAPPRAVSRLCPVKKELEGGGAGKCGFSRKVRPFENMTSEQT